uniref:myosin-10 isoform X2 n=1 Tax=Ciona intestinalis TaxID=7719 RepID=UPI0005215B77|nr:myosin-10 isoform X2 [Ciona intestinalis]|eukprot:XP_009859034.1 myosin-10 isoform X2 [Ciona intestinalis]
MTTKSPCSESEQKVKVVQLIKQLKCQNGKLVEENKSLKEELAVMHQRMEELANGEAIPSHDPNQPITVLTAKNQIIKEMTKQNLELQQKLEESGISREAALNQHEQEMLITSYRNQLKEKQIEINLLVQNSSDKILSEKMLKLSKTLQRTIAVNSAYTAKIKALQKEVKSLSCDCEPTQATGSNEDTTTVHAVSGDFDVASRVQGSSSGDIIPSQPEETKSPRSGKSDLGLGVLRMSSREELDLRPEFERVQKELYIMEQEKIKLEQKQEILASENSNLKEELEHLKMEKENLLRNNPMQTHESSDVGIYESQLKVFQEDFEAERNEKEQVMRQNQDLSQKMKELMDTIQSTQANSTHNDHFPTPRQFPRQTHSTSGLPQYEHREPMHHSPSAPGGLQHTQHQPPPPPNYRVPHSNEKEQPWGFPNQPQSHRFEPSHQPGNHNAPPRRIGFPQHPNPNAPNEPQSVPINPMTQPMPRPQGRLTSQISQNYNQQDPRKFEYRPGADATDHQKHP